MKTDLNEMKHFFGKKFSLMQCYKVGGIKYAFNTRFDVLIPPKNLGRHGIVYYHFKQLWDNLSFAKLPDGYDLEGMDTYWETDQFLDRVNNYYADTIVHREIVNVDELMAWFLGENSQVEQR